MQTSSTVDYAQLFSQHQEHLWGLCYRMTGSATEAEDLVQETFRRAIERPPADVSRSWRPWLVKVASNLSIDALRRRRTRRYDGPWLPGVVEVANDSTLGELARDESDVEVRYDLRESATLAFLVALEKLVPKQRAVLLLRDVLGYTGPEVAAYLELSTDNVRMLLHRARRAMQSYDAARQPSTAELDEHTRALLMRFIEAVSKGDTAALTACFAEDARTVSDGGGRVRAARKVVVGRDRVVKLLLGIAGKGPTPSRIELRTINLRPALVIDLPQTDPRDATRMVVQVETTPDATIDCVYIVASPDKLTAVRP